MKTTNFVRKFILAPTLILCSFFIFSSCSKTDGDSTNSASFKLSGGASGSQLSPAVAGSGAANISGTYNPDSHVITFTLNWANLSGPPTSGNLYAGVVGASGPQITSGWAYGPLGASGTITNSFELSLNNGTNLTNGNVYFTIGTAANPNGEVRGQVLVSR